MNSFMNAYIKGHTDVEIDNNFRAKDIFFLLFLPTVH